MPRKVQAIQNTKNNTTKTKQLTKTEVSALLHAKSTKIKIALKTKTPSKCTQKHCNTYKPRLGNSSSNNNNKNYVHNNNIDGKKSRNTDQPDDFMG